MPWFCLLAKYEDVGRRRHTYRKNYVMFMPGCEENHKLRHSKMNLTLNRLLAIVSILGISVGMLAAIVGAIYALDTRIDTKIRSATVPIAQDVREIRNTLQKFYQWQRNESR